MKKLIVIVLSFLLSGCAGLAVGTLGTFESSHEVVVIPREDKRWVLEWSGVGDKPQLTKESLIAKWGEPDDFTQVGSCEVLTYYDGYTWGGVWAMIIVIPIPLLIPTGHEENRFYFKDGELVHVVSEHNDTTGAFGYLCGSNECKFIAGAVHTDWPRNVEVTWCE